MFKLAATLPNAVDIPAAEEYTSQALRIVDRMSEFDAYGNGDALNNADVRNRNIEGALKTALLAGACRSGRVSFIKAA